MSPTPSQPVCAPTRTQSSERPTASTWRKHGAPTNRVARAGPLVKLFTSTPPAVRVSAVARRGLTGPAAEGAGEGAGFRKSPPVRQPRYGVVGPGPNPPHGLSQNPFL